MAERLSDTNDAIQEIINISDYLGHNALRSTMYTEIVEKTRIPHINELISLEHKMLDVDWLPDGEHPIEGKFHLVDYTFFHKDSKDPQRLIETLPNGETREHVYFSRGVSRDIITDPLSGEPVKDPRFYNQILDEPIPEYVGLWQVGHLIKDEKTGRWTEKEPVRIHGIEDLPQGCAPSVYFENGVFHMFLQGSCFFDNHPIYHLTSTDGTDFYMKRKILTPIQGTPNEVSTEAGLYDVDIMNDNGRYFVVYSGMSPMMNMEDRRAINEIHVAYIPSMEDGEEAERLVELERGLWVRVVRMVDGRYGYFELQDYENTSRVVRQADGSIVRLLANDDGNVSPLLYAEGTWVLLDEEAEAEWENVGYEESPVPGTPIITYSDIPNHNPHPPVRQADESESQRLAREHLEANFEWGLEGMQLTRLPNGLYLLLGVCFLDDEPIGNRQRAFMAVSDKITGPFTPIGLLLDPQEDTGWGDGKNGHASAEIIGDKLHILYQAKEYCPTGAPYIDQVTARWKIGEAICDVNDICRLAEDTLGKESAAEQPAFAS